MSGTASPLSGTAFPCPGFRVVRVSAELVLSDFAAAVALVRAAL